MEEVGALFGRFQVFRIGVKEAIHGIGLSAMERAAADRVHMHAYLHLARPFGKQGADALAVFEFEGARPHLAPNTAHGNAFQGAVKFGHFYVVCDKKGTLYPG